jgi:hypothetical protein
VSEDLVQHERGGNSAYGERGREPIGPEIGGGATNAGSRQPTDTHEGEDRERGIAGAAADGIGMVARFQSASV